MLRDRRLTTFVATIVTASTGALAALRSARPIVAGYRLNDDDAVDVYRVPRPLPAPFRGAVRGLQLAGRLHVWDAIGPICRRVVLVELELSWSSKIYLMSILGSQNGRKATI